MDPKDIIFSRQTGFGRYGVKSLLGSGLIVERGGRESFSGIDLWAGSKSK